MNNKKIIPIITILIIIAAIVGATFAYWSWTSDNANKTNITFTIGADFSCGANGGGNIASANLAPASCTNSTYAIKREITTTITNSGSSPVSLDMWLTVNSIGSGLSNTSNFKWALTTDSTTCSSNVINQGTFQGKTANSTVTILSGSTASTATYYLYIWLDSAETSTTTMNQSYSFSLGGTCTNEQPTYVYTANLYDDRVEGRNTVVIGQTIPNSITTYNTPEEAMAVLKSDFGAILGNTTDKPFYLMHKLNDNETVTESYVGFVITPEMVTLDSTTYMSSCNDSEFLSYYEFNDTSECIAAYSEPIAGTYTVKGGDGGDAFLANAKTLYDIFRGDRCSGANSDPPITYDATYNPDPSSQFYCYISGFRVVVDLNGIVSAGDDYSGCSIGDDGDSGCGT